MRHQGEDAGANRSVVRSVTRTLGRWTDPPSESETASGKHTSPGTQPRVPMQKQPTHETVEDAETVEAVATEESAPETPETPEATPELVPVRVPSRPVPAHAQWKAGHGPRMFAASLLLLSVAGTSALGLRYADTHGSDDFLSMAVGVGVVVALWALLIASTPQVISLRGSVLTVRNSSGSERFDLADGLQPVDLVGEPRSSHWALLLHRPNNTSVVLRRRDVDAVALDPIVRHYRAMADQRFTDRQVRFNR
jgi:hypothetical protein